MVPIVALLWDNLSQRRRGDEAMRKLALAENRLSTYSVLEPRARQMGDHEITKGIELTDCAVAADIEGEVYDNGDLHPASVDSDGTVRVSGLKVDPTQNYKASEIKLMSFARPHMRAFHYAWLSFFVGAASA